MPKSLKIGHHGPAGFTMLEMIIVIAVIAILAAMITPLAVNQITQARMNTCMTELQTIKKAIVGDPALIQGGVRSSFGFVGDVGVYPASLGELVSNTFPRPVYQSRSVTINGTPYSLSFGWRGPYVSDVSDPWGNPFQYSPHVVTATNTVVLYIWSMGPDGVTNNDPTLNVTDNQDNVLVTVSEDEYSTYVSGNTFTQCEAGGAFANISVVYPNPVNNPVGPTVPSFTPVQSSAIPNTTYATATRITIGLRLITFDGPTTLHNSKFLYLNNGPMTICNLKDPATCL